MSDDSAGKNGGYVRIHRSVFSHDLFKDEPFSEREAWIWLLSSASFKPHKMRHNFDMISVGRGQIPTSYRKLKEKWSWGNDRVRKFLDLLENEGMIRRDTGTGFLIITICNYEQYQGKGEISGTVSGTDIGTQTGTHQGTPPGTHPGTNINKGKERKEVIIDDYSAPAPVKNNVEEIYDWLMNLFQPGIPIPSAPVSAWLTWGADFELDIKPQARRYAAKHPNKPPNSLQWLDEDIAKSIKQRNKPMPEVAENEKTGRFIAGNQAGSGQRAITDPARTARNEGERIIAERRAKVMASTADQGQLGSPGESYPPTLPDLRNPENVRE